MHFAVLAVRRLNLVLALVHLSFLCSYRLYRYCMDTVGVGKYCQLPEV